jgi:SAM-dependent methyltransferase
MGASTLPLLMTLKRRGYIPNGAAVIEIGAQQLGDAFLNATDDIAATGRLFGITTPPPSFAWTGPRRDTNVLAGAPLAREFWTWLGLSYASIDIDGSPGSIPLDLNYDEVPSEFIGKYDVVTNFGTTEHVANQLQSFKIAHDLARPGGLMVHVLPASGGLNHGLVSYNPKFFWMLGRSNGYKIAFMTMGQSERNSGLPQNLLEFLALYEPKGADDFAAFRMPVTSIVVALQKLFDTPFVAPLDVPSDATTEHPSLRDRYWSVFKPDISFQARERDLNARIRDVYNREQALAAKEADIERRRRDVYEREQYVAAHERAAHMLVAPVRATHKLRRWLHARAPRWLIAAKRRMFGIATAKSDGTRSRGT